MELELGWTAPPQFFQIHILIKVWLSKFLETPSKIPLRQKTVHFLARVNSLQWMVEQLLTVT